MRMGTESVALVFIPENANLETKIGATHASSGGGNSVPGTLEHLASNVDTQEDILALHLTQA